MAKYIVQMRRGTANQWADSSIVPLAGEIVVEIDEVNNLHKLKIGDGEHAYSELAYLMAGDEIVSQVLNQAIPRVITVTLDVEKWTEVTNEINSYFGCYSQTITIDNITEHSRLDLQPDVNMLAEFKKLGLAFITENKNGVITVYSVGDMPLESYVMQATILETEVVIDSDKIIGIPVGAPIVKSDWNQTDTTKSDYIKNKPGIENNDDGSVSVITNISINGKATVANAPVNDTEVVRKLELDNTVSTLEGEIGALESALNNIATDAEIAALWD